MEYHSSFRPTRKPTVRHSCGRILHSMQSEVFVPGHSILSILDNQNFHQHQLCKYCQPLCGKVKYLIANPAIHGMAYFDTFSGTYSKKNHTRQCVDRLASV